MMNDDDRWCSHHRAVLLIGATTKKSKFGLLLAANKSDRELLIEKVDIHLLLLFSLLPSSSPHNFTEKLIAHLLPILSLARQKMHRRRRS